MRRYLYWGLVLQTLVACSKPAAFEPYVPDYPAHFPKSHYNNGANRITEAGFQLGRRLFYDPLLSKDGSVSCGSCHHQSYAFADFPSRRRSPGVGGALGPRNSPALFNLAWQPHFMWDGGINHLDVMSLAPITNPLEMDERMDRVLAKLQAHPDYPQLFRQAYGRDTIDSQQLFWALSQFMLALVSSDSPYDAYLQGRSELSAEAKRGLALFERHCASCHPAPLFSDFSFRSNGLTEGPSLDLGRGLVSTFVQDYGKFKVPSLRNVALTPPYMHDGRLNSLEEVLNHYAHGIRAADNLDPLLPVGGLGLSEQEKAEIIAFLHSLTDETFIHNPAFAPR
jgi:cytochrome c peroxidase